MTSTRLLGMCGIALMLVTLVGTCVPAHAESDLAGSAGASVELDFRIIIPNALLFLRVGTLGSTVDTISFDLTDLPGSGAVAGTSSGADPVPVRAAGFLPPGGTMVLSADSSTALDAGGGNTIPFDQISWSASGDFSGGTFDGSSSQILASFSGSGNRTGTYSFSYANDNYYPSGTYQGSVTYTLSSP